MLITHSGFHCGTGCYRSRSTVGLSVASPLPSRYEESVTLPLRPRGERLTKCASKASGTARFKAARIVNAV